VYHMCEVNQLGEIRVSISNGLHKELKQVALDRGITLKQLIIEVFERCAEEDRQPRSTISKGKKEVKS